jgi:hypothetical protein
MVKSRRNRWAGHVASMLRSGLDIAFGWEGQNERDNKEDVEVSGRII